MDKVVTQLYKNTDSVKIYNRTEMLFELKKISPAFKDSSLNWQMYNLRRRGKIQRIGRNQFRVVNLHNFPPMYTYELSEMASLIKDSVAENFPNIMFVVWETIQLNEFLVHQLARNVIFIETERFCESTIFEFIRERYKNLSVLIKPDRKSISLYQGDITAVILKLSTEFPQSGQQRYQSAIEKILVDMLSNKLISELISRSEYETIFSETIQRYFVDETKMLRYARRHNKEPEIRKLLDAVRENND